MDPKSSHPGGLPKPVPLIWVDPHTIKDLELPWLPLLNIQRVVDASDASDEPDALDVPDIPEKSSQHSALSEAAKGLLEARDRFRAGEPTKQNVIGSLGELQEAVKKHKAALLAMENGDETYHILHGLRIYCRPQPATEGGRASKDAASEDRDNLEDSCALVAAASTAATVPAPQATVDNKDNVEDSCVLASAASTSATVPAPQATVNKIGSATTDENVRLFPPRPLSDDRYRIDQMKVPSSFKVLDPLYAEINREHEAYVKAQKELPPSKYGNAVYGLQLPDRPREWREPDGRYCKFYRVPNAPLITHGLNIMKTIKNDPVAAYDWQQFNRLPPFCQTSWIKPNFMRITSEHTSKVLAEAKSKEAQEKEKEEQEKEKEEEKRLAKQLKRRKFADKKKESRRQEGLKEAMKDWESSLEVFNYLMDASNVHWENGYGGTSPHRALADLITPEQDSAMKFAAFIRITKNQIGSPSDQQLLDATDFILGESERKPCSVADVKMHRDHINKWSLALGAKVEAALGFGRIHPAAVREVRDTMKDLRARMGIEAEQSEATGAQKTKKGKNKKKGKN